MSKGAKPLVRALLGTPLFGCQQILGGHGKVPDHPVMLCLSPLQGDSGVRGDRGEPGEKGRDGAPVSPALLPWLALTQTLAGTNPIPVSILCSRVSRVREGWQAQRGSR